jgi:hypothetical protein
LPGQAAATGKLQAAATGKLQAAATGVLQAQGELATGKLQAAATGVLQVILGIVQSPINIKALNKVYDLSNTYRRRSANLALIVDSRFYSAPFTFAIVISTI